MNTKSFLFLVMLMVSFLGLSAQKQKADKQKADTMPAAVTAAFEREYPEGKVKDWALKGDKYIANAKIDGQTALAYFTTSGNWIETVYEISDKEMPGRIENYLNNNYPGAVVVTSQYKENKSNGAFYFLQLKKNKGSQDVDADLFFDVSGNFQTKTEYHPLTEALSSSTKQEAERKAKAEAEKADYEARREALLKSDRTVSENNMPSKVKDNFRKKFPKASEIKWDSLDNVYTAHFIENEMNITSNWSLSGDWLSTTETLPNGPIFRPVDLYLEQNYGSNVISLAQRITSRDKNSGFYVEVHPKAKKGTSPPVTKLWFDKAGRFLKAEEPEKATETVAENNETQEAVSDEPDEFENKLSKEDKTTKEGVEDITALKVSAKELPSKALTYISENYPEYKVKEAFFSDYEDMGNCYKVTIRKEGVNQKPSEMYFSDRGDLLREDNPPPKKSELEAAKKEKEQQKAAVKGKVKEEEIAEEKPAKEDEEEAEPAEGPESIDVASVPDIIKKNFSRRYPRAVDPVWKSSDKKYFVEFYFNEIKNILEFTPDGIIQVTRTETDPARLFGPIQRYLQDNYKNYKVRYAETITRKDRKNYFYVEIFSKKRNANPPEMQLYFDKVGKLMQNPPE